MNNVGKISNGVGEMELRKKCQTFLLKNVNEKNNDTNSLTSW